MLQAVFPSLWRTELSDKVLTWTKFGLIVLNCPASTLLQFLLLQQKKLTIITDWTMTHLLKWECWKSTSIPLGFGSPHLFKLSALVLLHVLGNWAVGCQCSWNMKNFWVSTCWWTSITNTTLLSGTPKQPHPGPAFIIPTLFDLLHLINT